MRKHLKTLLVASTLAAGLGAAPALYAHDSDDAGGSTMGRDMMDQDGRMDQDGMMGMMGQMSSMMENCNRMMQAMMEGEHDPARPNEQRQERSPQQPDQPDRPQPQEGDE
jgi:hypothetical protein